MKKTILATMIATMSAAAVHAQTAQPAQTAAPGPPGAFQLGVEGLVWWFQDTPVPVPLVTDLIVGLPDTATFLGGEDLSTGASAGGRITGGYSLTEGMSLEGSFFFIPDNSTTRSVSSSGEIGSVDLIVPYLDANTGQENGTEISFAPIYGATAIETYTVGMLGAEVNGALAILASPGFTVDALAGIRYLNLREKYAFATSSPYVPPFPAGIWATLDRFDTTNNFYGLQPGVRARYDGGAFFGTATLKVGLGAMVQSVHIQGSLVTDEFTSDGSTQTFAGGYFALPSNIGDYSRTAFAFVPEIDLRAGWRIAPDFSILLGYSFLYASDVARPGNQIDRTINTTQSTAYTENPNPIVVGPAAPVLEIHDSSFWAQGASFGIAYRF